jgi:hypothetical protein
MPFLVTLLLQVPCPHVLLHESGADQEPAWHLGPDSGISAADHHVEELNFGAFKTLLIRHWCLVCTETGRCSCWKLSNVIRMDV